MLGIVAMVTMLQCCDVGRLVRSRWSVAVEATGWELMIQFARYGLGITVVNDFCPVPRGFVGVPFGGVPKVSYSVITRRVASSDPRDTLVQMILDAAGT